MLRAPAEFFAKRLEEILVPPLDDADGVPPAAYVEHCLVGAGLVSPVHGYEIVVVAAVYVERQLPLVGNQDGPRI